MLRALCWVPVVCLSACLDGGLSRGECDADHICEPQESYADCPRDCFRSETAGPAAREVVDGRIVEIAGNGICELRENWRATDDCAVTCGDGTLTDEDTKDDKVCLADELFDRRARLDPAEAELRCNRDGFCDHPREGAPVCAGLPEETVEDCPEDCVQMGEDGGPHSFIAGRLPAENESCDASENCSSSDECRAGGEACVGDYRCAAGEGADSRDCTRGLPDECVCDPMSAPGCAECGNGVVEAGEECEDGNQANDDACVACEAARCGDGEVWAGMEECDDGNEEPGDGCDGCKTEVAMMCGDGKVEGNEPCDDGNESNEDGCLNNCEEARCGDGVVWAGMEGCDDGNEEDGDGCPSGAVGQCQAEAACGDGVVWAGMEGCDDGNEVDEDGCPSGAVGECQAEAVCGDGVVWAGMEECDDGNEDDLDECNNDCAAPRTVFLTSELKTGALGGLVGADAYCQELAEEAGLTGTYMAWLTDGDAANEPAQRFGSTEFRGWYMLPNKTPVARGWEDLTTPNDGMPDDYLQAAITVTEGGVDAIGAPVWTNTDVAGKRATETAHCMDWSKIKDGMIQLFGRRATAEGTSSMWTDSGQDADCSFGLRIYCFQVG
jgi:cysteine-rich repeat protein